MDHSHSCLGAAESIGVLATQPVLGEEIKDGLNLNNKLLCQGKRFDIFLSNTRFGCVENSAISHLYLGDKQKSNLLNLLGNNLYIALRVLIAHLDRQTG